LKSFLFTTDSS